MPKGKYTAQDIQGQYSAADVDEPASAHLLEEDRRQKGPTYERSTGGTAVIAPAPKWYSLEGLEDTAKRARNFLINQLPTVGGIGGGIIGGGVGLESGPGDVLTAGAGAAAGGALGEDAREALFEKLYPMQKKMSAKESAENIGKSAAVQGLSELLPRIVGGMFRPATAVEKLSYVGKLGPHEDIAPAMGEILKTEKIGGNKVTTVGQYLNVLKETKQRIGNEVNIALRNPVKVHGEDVPLAGAEADTTSISDRIKSLASKHPSEEETNPAKLASFKQRALMYESKPHTYGWLFDRRQVLNEELNRFYSLSTPGDKEIFLHNHPDFEADKAEADAIRDLIYPEMDKAAGKPVGYFRDLQRKQGAIIAVENATQKRVEDLEAAANVQRGAPLRDRLNVSTYGTPPGRMGLAVHRLHSLVSKPNPVGGLDSAVKGAFGHSAMTSAGHVISSTPSIEIMSLPLRYLLTPDETPTGPKTTKLRRIVDEYRSTAQ